MKDKKRGFLQISFPWLFALIVGAIILFLAIYASTKIANTEQTSLDAATAKKIGVLLNPLETGFETGKTTTIELPSETRIYNRCNNEGNFGRQIIKLSQKSFNKWSDTGVDVGFSNKYIFSEDFEEGKKFLLFSKPFNFPFKVSDLIYLTSEDKSYCFIDAPENIQKEISNFNQDNLRVDNCASDSIKVCFSGGDNCSVNVNYQIGSVIKNGNTFNVYGDALMYAAIFSGKDVYECQVKRIMQRGEKLSLIYEEKAQFVSQNSCNSNIDQELLELRNLESGFSSTENLNIQLISLVQNIESKNDVSECKLW